MKKSLPTVSTVRASTGCLPVPIFNQKKRSRQPLTSFPQNEQCSSKNSLVSDSSDFCGLSTDLIWEPQIPPLNNQSVRMDNSLQVPHHEPYQQVQQYKTSTTSHHKISTGMTNQLWPGKKSLFHSSGSDKSLDVTYGKPLSIEKSKEQKVYKQYHFHAQSGKKLTEQVSASTSNRSSQYTPSVTKDLMPSLKNNSKISKHGFVDMAEEEIVQVPVYQMNIKEKSNSLRILPANIESMRHWSQITDKICLLFEVLATLDSAVTSGAHGSKIFLLRDGKHSVPCVFYEIDRELPRLIRGRVHRSMGNYDKKRNLFKCFSVRPASVAEQETFHQFLTAANREMKQFVTLNEI
ncbi:spermatogenesis-associated protein 22 isoform X2 [Xenopus tropicalis]|uniref:Spermatogenesis-associated protein 22 isoform X2 n=1 Tax=Xenopus tropicalis TaxID=8364 RepID=A0A8J1J3T7_XENTR|nr:spermatogenesis-associated protein 22 isoform X2 [Xenopus tropicalis]